MVSQTQDIAGQQSFVWDFLFLGGGGGRVLKYLHRGLLGFTGSLLKSGHYKCSQCMTLLQCLWSIMLSTFPPFGIKCMLGGCLLQGCHGWLCITLSCCFLPHKATSLWDTSPKCCMLMGLICSQIIDCVWKYM